MSHREEIGVDELYRRMAHDTQRYLLTDRVEEGRVIVETVTEADFPQWPNVRRVSVYVMHPATYAKARNAAVNYFDVEPAKPDSNRFALAGAEMRVPLEAFALSRPDELDPATGTVDTPPFLEWSIHL